MGAPTLGAQLAAIIGFVCMTMFLGPLITLVAPASFNQLYFSANGIVNSTYATQHADFDIPVLQTANTSTGFQAAGNLLNSAFSPLAFIYGGLGLFWKSLTNEPTLLWLILTNLSSSVVFVPVAAGAIFSIIMFSYVIVGDFMKVLSMWMKSDAENVGY